MNFLSVYSHLIVKDIMKDIAKENRQLERYAERERKALDNQEVRTSRHWKAVAGAETSRKGIDKKLADLNDLDIEVNWTDKLHQDRFSFVKDKYRKVYVDYLWMYGDNDEHEEAFKLKEEATE